MFFNDYVPIHVGDRDANHAITSFELGWQDRTEWTFGAFDREGRLILGDMENQKTLHFHHAARDESNGFRLRAAVDILLMAGLGREFGNNRNELKKAVLNNPDQLFTKLPNDPAEVLQ